MIICHCKSVFVELEGGFWGLETDDGQRYLPMVMVEQLKTKGVLHKVTLRPLDVMGIQMWGDPVEIVSFTTSPT